LIPTGFEDESCGSRDPPRCRISTRLSGRGFAALTKTLSQTGPFDTLCVPILTDLVSQRDVSPLFSTRGLTDLLSATIGGVGH
jgi:tRNA(His) 5'-end guanylyltransferase